MFCSVPDFLHNYLFLRCGNVGAANTDVEQTIHEVRDSSLSENVQRLEVLSCV
jgi:hypothetical protein